MPARNRCLLVSLSLTAGVAFTALPSSAAPTAARKSPPKPAAKPASESKAPRLEIERLEVHPAEITLNGPRSTQRLLVMAQCADGLERDVTESATMTVGRKDIATLDEADHALLPAGDGETTLTAALNGKSARVKLRVTGMAAPAPVSFVNDVMPVLTRAGCNQAACHGAQTGKGGFKLSLFGYDPSADYQALTQKKDAAPSRIEGKTPDESLLLRKAALAVSHGGGKRLTPGTLPYRVLRDWIAGGAPVPNGGPALARIEVEPAERLFGTPGKGVTGGTQRLVVRAVYADGSQRDVSSLAHYSAQDVDAVEVTDEGEVTPVRPGANAVMVRYAGQVATFRLQVPFAWPVPKNTYPRPVNLIDEKVFARLGQLGLPLSDAAEDLEFLRRVSLDLTGSLPAPDEVRKFAADRDPDKRKKAVEALLQRDEHAYFWAQKFSDLFKVNSRDLGQDGMLNYYGYLLQSFRSNKPWDRIARELVLSRPNSTAEGSFYLTARTPEDRAMSTAEVFLGVRIQCAQCHQHPFEKWSQDDFWQFASFFARVPDAQALRPGNIRGKPAFVPVQPQAVQTAEVINPRTKQPAFPPRPLGGAPIPDPDMRGDRREHLADWLTAPENPWFAKAIVNRVWKHFFGRGIVDPVDDLRETNPASDPALLDALAKEFTASGYDLRALLRLVTSSRTYQTNSKPVAGNREDTRFFSHAYFRRLTAEQLADAIAHATGIPDEYPPYEPGIRAIQLPDPQAAAPFLDAFGRPGRTQACECERTNDPSIAQALRLITGPGLSNKATAGNGRIARMMFFTSKSGDEIWEELYYFSLCRPPKPSERQAWKEHLAARFAADPNNKTGATQEALEDWFWALLNSKEFLFNH